MKVKVKLDMAGIKSLALEHGEKAAFAIVLIVFVGFVYGGARREVLDSNKQPDRLKSLASEVKTHVQSSTWDPKRVDLQVVNYIDRTNRETIAADKYALVTPLNPPIFDAKSKREDPQLFNAEELRIGAGYGTFAMRGAEAAAPAAGGRPAASPPGATDFSDRPGAMPARGGAPPRAVSTSSGRKPHDFGHRPSPNSVLKTTAWAVVTGLIPYDKQAAEYNRAFEHAAGYSRDRDVPRYLGYQLERAEISNAAPDKLEWKPVKNVQFEKQFETSLDDVVDPAYIVNRLTNRLGPLVGKAWGESVTHPKVPLAWAKPAATESVTSEVVAEPAKDDAKEKPPESADEGLVIEPLKPQQPAVQAVRRDDAPAAVPYRLLRVFDYSVERGKRYRYRIKLALANPNYQIPAKDLKAPDKRPEAVRGQYVFTPEWSEPTEIVTIPNGSGVLAGGIKPQRGTSQVLARLILTAIDPDKGIEAAVEKDFDRGAVANSVESDVNALDPVTETVTKLPKVNFQSNMVVLDFYGGKLLGRPRSGSATPLTSPAEVLLLDQDGNLTVHGELDDRAAYETPRPPEEIETRSAEKEKPAGSDAGRRAKN